MLDLPHSFASHYRYFLLISKIICVLFCHMCFVSQVLWLKLWELYPRLVAALLIRGNESVICSTSHMPAACHEKLAYHTRPPGIFNSQAAPEKLLHFLSSSPPFLNILLSLHHSSIPESCRTVSDPLNSSGRCGLLTAAQLPQCI